MSSKAHPSDKSAIETLQFSKTPHIMIVEARFYDDLNDMMLAGAKDVLVKMGASFEVLTVPGALEIPAAIHFASQRRQGPAIDAFVALGCVIRGETFHFEIVSVESTRGLTSLALQSNLAIGNAILTCDTFDQALERADPSRQDKAGEAAVAALTMLHLKQACGLNS